jgi:predicted MFS family arabinose efflux permease
VSGTQRWVLALASVAALMVALDQLVVATALNTIRNDLHASIATLGWTVDAYSLSFAVLLVTGGLKSLLIDILHRLRAGNSSCSR